MVVSILPSEEKALLDLFYH